MYFQLNMFVETIYTAYMEQSQANPHIAPILCMFYVFSASEFWFYNPNVTFLVLSCHASKFVCFLRTTITHLKTLKS